MDARSRWEAGGFWPLVVGVMLLAPITAVGGTATGDAARGTGGNGDALEDAVELAWEASSHQALMAGLDLSTGPPAAPPMPPGDALRTLHARASVPWSGEAEAAVGQFDLLPVPVHDALGAFLTAFLAFDEAAGAPGPQHGRDDQGLAPLLASRVRLLDAAEHLAATGPATMEEQSQRPIHIPPVIAIDIQGEDSTYVEDYVVVIDLGGNDLYLNNAGGSNFRGAPCISLSTYGAAALVDAGGDDRYVSGRSCGINGGGRYGAGFLYDAAGDDVYSAGSTGVNGGATFGLGMLWDASGNDTYIAAGSRWEGVNGAAENPIWCFIPMLNGCAMTQVFANSYAGLVDLGGMDAYQEQSFACLDCTVAPKGVLGVQLDVFGMPGEEDG